MNKFTIEEKDGSITEYAIDQVGVIHQLYPQRFTYDEKYVSKYNTPKYTILNDALQKLRIGFVLACWGGEFTPGLLDVGFGNGAFVKAAQQSDLFAQLYGYDVTDVRIPRNVARLGDDWTDGTYNIVTFWDVLEHFPDLSFLATLKADMVVISCPWCHYNDFKDSDNEKAVEYFTDWHHRKPNEHLHHFDRSSLVKTMVLYGWQYVQSCSIEDLVRKGKDRRPPNILTAAFKREIPGI